MLSISIFIALMAKRRNCTDIKIAYISDNLELINRSKEHLDYISPYPNNTLSAEYDITKQIYLTNKTYTKDILKMCIEAKLNVEVDRLVGNYLDKLGAYNPITHMYPSSTTVLEINGMTITSNIQ